MRVLVADDDAIARMIVSSALQGEAEVVVAKDGAQALSMFSEGAAQSSPFDLVILDISMPEVDGLDALAAIRVKEAELGVFGSRGVRAIILTANSETHNLYDANALDCDSYLLKPIDVAKLRREVFRVAGE